MQLSLSTAFDKPNKYKPLFEQLNRTYRGHSSNVHAALGAAHRGPVAACGPWSPGAELGRHPPSPSPSLLLGLSLPGTPAWVQGGQSSRKWGLLRRPWRLSSPTSLPSDQGGVDRKEPAPAPARSRCPKGDAGHQVHSRSTHPLLPKPPQPA